MAVYEAEDPQTGVILELTTDGPEPTDAELEELFAQYAMDSQPQSVPGSPGLSLGQQIGGAVDVGASLASSAVAEPAGGLAGLATALMTGDPAAGVAVQEGARDALTIGPNTEAGRQQMQALGEAFAPVGEFVEDIRTGAGDFAFEAAGGGEAGAAAGAAAQTLPEAAVASLPVVGKILRDTKNQVLQSRRSGIGEKIAAGETDNVTARYILDGAGDVQKDAFGKEAIRQGFDEGVVAAIKGSNDADLEVMRKMTSVLEQGKGNARFAADPNNNPRAVLGDSLKNKVVVVRDANRRAGKAIDQAANGLKGKDVDYAPAVDEFLADLEDLGIRFDDATGRVSYGGSDLEGLSGPQTIINNVVRRMLNTKTPDAYDVHRLKRFLDENVTYGKSAEGLTGRAESVIKSLRHNLDGALDDTFPAYAKANEAYADTISALNALQDIAGQKVNITDGKRSGASLGRLARRVTGNLQSTERLLEAVEEVVEAANKYGAGPIAQDDLITQVMYMNELERVFGATTQTSFMGDVTRGVSTALRESGRSAVLDFVGNNLDNLRGVNEAGQFAAMRQLLANQMKRKRQRRAGPPKVRQ